MKTNFDEYVAITEFMDKLISDIDHEYGIRISYKNIMLIIKRYEEFKIEMEGEK